MSIEPQSGVEINYSEGPVTSMVEAEDGSSQSYQVNINDDPYALEVKDNGPAGGIVFYINPNYATDGWRYMEVGNTDLGTGAWGSSDLEVSGAEGTVIGTGKQNSLDIIAGDPQLNKPADLCANYSVEVEGVTYNDWHLPSRDELKEILDELHIGGDKDGKSQRIVLVLIRAKQHYGSIWFLQ